MGVLEAIADLLYVALAILAWAVARRDRSHRPLAAYITWMAGSEVVRLGLDAVKAGAPRPYTGLARVVGHGDHFFVLSWSFLFVALCLHYFLGQKKPWAPIVAWLATFAVIVLSYPAVRGHTLGLVYETVALGALLISWGCITWAILRRRGMEPKLAHLAIILYASSDVGVLILQSTHDYFKEWPISQLANVVLLLALLAVHGVELTRRARREEAVA